MGRGGSAARAPEVVGAPLPATRGTGRAFPFQSARRYQPKPLGHQALTSNHGKRTGFPELGPGSPLRGAGDRRDSE